MAGIGFELQRALRGGSLAKVLTVAITGIVIVAGPWLISIVGISILTGTASFVLREGQSLFIGAIVYGYAFSILLFGGLHYIFTRYVSDLIYKGQFHRTTAALVLMSIAVLALSLAIGTPFALALRSPAVSHLGLFRLAMVVFFVAINLLWIEMLLVTILKGFLAIIGGYLAGMLASVGATIYLGRSFGVGGAFLGFSLGQLLVALILFVVMMRWNHPTPALRELRPLLAYARRYRALMLSGWLYSAGLWIDKIVFWFGRGEPLHGSFIHLYDSYDQAAYLANLSVIPVLVFFTVFTETTFFAGLRRLLLKLRTGTYSRIAEEKYAFLRITRKIVLRQSFFHALLVVVLLAAIPGTLAKILVIGVLFHMAFLTFFTFLFYIESYGIALRGSLVFFGVNFLVSVASARFNVPPPGLGYLLAGLAACLYAGAGLFRNLGELDRIIFRRN